MRESVILKKKLWMKKEYYIYKNKKKINNL